MEQINQENEQLKKENQLLRKTLNNLKGDKASDTLVNAVNAVYEPLLQDRVDDIEKLNKQLAEKDKEIKNWKKEARDWKEEHRLADRFNKELCEKYSYPAQDLEPQLRHEICEKIKEKLETSSFEMLYNGSDYGRFMAILDQIEQGDE